MAVDMREHVRWMLTRVPDSPMQEIGVEQSDAAIIAAFTVITERALGEAPALESIRRLISAIRGTYVKAESLQPVQAEAVVRAVYGEEDLLEGMSYRDTVQTQLSVTYGILQTLQLTESEFESFVDEAARLAEEITAGEQ
jgi:hypothetical protein